MWNNEITYEIEGENGTRITCTSFSALKKLTERLEKDLQQDAETLLPFEFIIGSLFPNCYNDIKDFATKQFLDGYNTCKKEMEQ